MIIIIFIIIVIIIIIIVILLLLLFLLLAVLLLLFILFTTNHTACSFFDTLFSLYYTLTRIITLLNTSSHTRLHFELCIAIYKMNIYLLKSLLVQRSKLGATNELDHACERQN